MKILPIAGAFAALALLASCAQPTEEKTFKAESLTVTSDAAYKYYNLANGEEVTGADINSNVWDVAFNSGTGGIRTNSGATAEALTSGGAGGVYYAGTTTFDDVVSVKNAKYNDAYSADTLRWVATAGQSGVTKSQAYLNQITKLDYSAGDGLTEATAFENDGTPGVYDGTAYYSYAQAGVVVSSEVYVIRHADGKAYSKLQVTSMTGSSASRVRVIKYANF